MTNAVAFWKNGSLAECVLWEISGTFIGTKYSNFVRTCLQTQYTMQKYAQKMLDTGCVHKGKIPMYM